MHRNNFSMNYFQQEPSSRDTHQGRYNPPSLYETRKHVSISFRRVNERAARRIETKDQPDKCECEGSR